MSANVPSVRRRLAENIKRVRGRIEQACVRAKRDPDKIRLVAVTKSVEIDVVRQALDAGLVDLGESRPQQLNQRAGMIHEFIERRTVLGGRRERPLSRPRWHMVGHLQRNKVKLVVPWVELIHSVDSLRLAEDLHTQATKLGRVVDILLQVSTSGEKAKSGVAVGAALHLAEQFAGWSGIRLRGLMTMAPLEARPGELRLCFERLHEVFRDMRDEEVVGPEFTELSMGMSEDFETGIECGATMVRLGHALFEGLSSQQLSEIEEPV
ncbi:MAG: YggS family pyridoxal phosphate-dependent enzyme [Phycisphaerae bacterium]